MRQNLSVTQQAINIPEHYRLMSRNDTHGNILQINYEFIEVSGYSEDELIGQPDQLLRHPDMPDAVLKDMRDTLKKGQSWSQILKHRAKSGDLYWVKVNATPLMESGQYNGYISIQKSATAQEMATANDAFQKINAHTLTIHNARMMTPQQRRSQKLNAYARLGLMSKILVPAILILVIASVIAAIFAQRNYQAAKAVNESSRFETLHNQIINKLSALQDAGLNSAIGLSTNTTIQTDLAESKSSALSKAVLEEKLPAYERVSGQKYKVQIHRPDATSFLRSWSDKQDDDLGSFRFTIKQVVQSQQAKAAIELGRTGIAIRSLSPIFSHDNAQNYIGSIEIITPITALQEYLAKDNTHYVVVLTPNAIEIAREEAQNPKLGQYTLATQTGIQLTTVGVV